MPSKSKPSHHRSHADRVREELQQIEEKIKAIESLNSELETGLANGVDPDFSRDQVQNKYDVS